MPTKQHAQDVTVPPAHKPLITVTPSSKLMSRTSMNQMAEIHLSPKSSRKRRSLRLCTSSMNNKPESQCNTNNSESPITSIQDLTVNAQHKNIASMSKDNSTTNKSPSNSMTHHAQTNSHHHFLPPPPNLYPLRHNLLPPSNQPRFIHPMNSQHHQMPPHMQNHQLPSSHRSPQINTSGMLPNLSCHPITPPLQQIPSIPTTPPPTTPTFPPQPETTRMFGPNPPPITILVPYPIILPIPIPIPIPMPIIEFLRAAQAKLDMKKNSENNNNSSNTNHNSNNNTKNVDEPLDFTKSKETDLTSKYTSIPVEPSIKVPLALEKEESSSIEEHKIILSQSSDEGVSHKIVTEQNDLDNEESPQKQQRLPKFKITRLNSKRVVTASTLAAVNQRTVTPTQSAVVPQADSPCTTTKESPAETSRPLRKRKRVVDCDY